MTKKKHRSTPELLEDEQIGIISRLPPTIHAANDNDGTVSRESLTALFFALNAQSCGATIAQGQAIQRGKDGLPHGEFTPWLVEDLRLGDPKAALWKAEMYMLIARHPVLSDPKCWPNLPSSYRKLYELTQIRPIELLIEWCDAGRVHHDITFKEAEKLKHESRQPPTREFPKPLVPLLNNVRRVVLKQVLIDAIDSITEIPPESPDEDIDGAVKWLKEEIKKVRGAA